MDIKTNIPKVNKNDLLDAVLQKLKLQFGTVDVGFFVGSAKYKGGKDVTTVARDNDKGTKKIPERPFMIPARNKAANKTINITIHSIACGMDEQQALSRAGIMFKNAIQKEITNLKEPPNAEYTIEKKGSSNPLIDTGLMRSKVDWKLRPPK
ncbi:hypothetical protein [Helicobacter typhlonius]|uniref:hypothetical protein n=1 Tax=Helicobacter typhlonius TaxID=76936 RepID=UPI002FE0D8CC